MNKEITKGHATPCSVSSQFPFVRNMICRNIESRMK